MPVPLIDLAEQHARLAPQITSAFESMLTSGRFILGPAVEGFEKALADYCGAQHAIGVSSGTDALIVALLALGVGPGDEVVTSPFTFFATAGSIARIGATPVFVDIEPDTFNLDPALFQAAVTPKTKAVMPVHLFGQTAEMEPIMRTARAHRLKVVEDACQAIGARDGSHRVGAIGDAGAFSFYPTKNLSALGDAGAVTVNDPTLAQKVAQLRQHGMSKLYQHDSVGGNFRLDAVQASVLSIKLPLLDGYTSLRRRHAARYGELLAGLPLTLPVERPGKFHVFNQYTVRVHEGRRDALKRHLAARGIGHNVYYPIPLHLQPCFAYLGYKPGSLPVSERASEEVLSLPIFPEMTGPQQDEVVAAVREFFK